MATSECLSESISAPDMDAAKSWPRLEQSSHTALRRLTRRWFSWPEIRPYRLHAQIANPQFCLPRRCLVLHSR